MARTVREYLLPLVEGADFDEIITWTVDGDAVDLSTYSATLRIGRSGTTELTLSEGAGLTLASDGTIRVQITDAQTDALPSGSQLYYELDVTDAGGIITRLLSGRVQMSERVAS